MSIKIENNVRWEIMHSEGKVKIEIDKIKNYKNGSTGTLHVEFWIINSLNDSKNFKG